MKKKTRVRYDKRLRIGARALGVPVTNVTFVDINFDPNDPCSTFYTSVDKLVQRNGSGRCHGCNAPVVGGDGTCRYCGRSYDRPDRW